jgi:hypothetical protein
VTLEQIAIASCPVLLATLLGVLVWLAKEMFARLTRIETTLGLTAVDVAVQKAAHVRIEKDLAEAKTALAAHASRFDVVEDRQTEFGISLGQLAPQRSRR